MKPENLVFDKKGYLYLTDFGIAAKWSRGMDNHDEVSGTPGYMAPEVMLNRNHGLNSDFFALGVIAAECMTGKRPYRGKNKNAIRDAMLAKQVVIEKDEDCDWADYPDEAIDFINKCLQKKPEDRMSSFQEVKNHPWFEDFDWEEFISMKMQPIFVPPRGEGNFDKKNIAQEENDQDQLQEYIAELKDPETHDIFKNYYYDRDFSSLKKQKSKE